MMYPACPASPPPRSPADLYDAGPGAGIHPPPGLRRGGGAALPTQRHRRAMARQQTDKIAFLICKEGATILDEFYASICEGVMRRANGTNYQLLISTAEEWTRTAQSKQIEGVILAGNAQADLISEFQRQNIPVVLVNNRAAGFDLPCIVADEAGGVRQVVSHLISAGHQRIAVLMGRFSPYVTSARYNAFLSVMRENGLSVDESGALMCDRDIQSATEAATPSAEPPGSALRRIRL
ncbi:MAG: hypothetical protein ACLSHO_10430 [Dysosmobacter sp.]